MTRQKATTPEQILAVAIELFNAKGTAAMSTNHIAEAAGISPGNLYYHFKNKRDILRGILERMTADWDGAYAPFAGGVPDAAQLRAVIAQTYELLWDYRFFYRELVALLRSDVVLARRYRAIYRQRQQEQFALFDRLVAAGYARAPKSRAEIQETLTLVWLVGNYWLIHLETNGDAITPENVQQGVELVMRLLAPYFIKEFMQ